MLICFLPFIIYPCWKLLRCCFGFCFSFCRGDSLFVTRGDVSGVDALDFPFHQLLNVVVEHIVGAFGKDVGRDAACDVFHSVLVNILENDMGDFPQLPDNQPVCVKIAYDVQEGLSNELFAR